MSNNVLSYYSDSGAWKRECEELETRFGHDFNIGDIVIPKPKAGYGITNAENEYIGMISGFRSGHWDIHVYTMAFRGSKTDLSKSKDKDFTVNSRDFVLAPPRIWEALGSPFPYQYKDNITDTVAAENDELFKSLF